MKKNRAFTLVELMIVVAVIALLMALILPAAHRVQERARRTSAQNSMKQIATAFNSYYQEHGSIPDADSSVELIEQMASEEVFNDANLFIYEGDSRAAAVLRDNIWPLGDGTTTEIHAWERGRPLSVVLIGNIGGGVDLSTTPIAFTRGLDETTGQWNSDGPFGQAGGFIAFLDGTVRFYKNLSSNGGKLSTKDTSTSSILEVLETISGRILPAGIPSV